MDENNHPLVDTWIQVVIYKLEAVLLSKTEPHQWFREWSDRTDSGTAMLPNLT